MSDQLFHLAKDPLPLRNPNYHVAGDVPERCDVPNAAMAVQATLAAILTLDQAAPENEHVTGL